MADFSLFSILFLCAFVLIDGSRSNRIFYDLDSNTALRLNLSSRHAFLPLNSHRVPIYLGLAVQHGLDLDARLEIFSLVSVLHLKWTIEDLKWNPSDFGGISSITMPVVFIPKPIIHLANRAKMPRIVDGLNSGLVFVSKDGVIEWRVRLVAFVFCATHLRNFPFDRHECRIRLENPPGSKQSLLPLAIDSYLENPNSEWRVRSGGVHSVESRLIFSFIFERVPYYYIIVLATPLAVATIATLLTFWLPPWSAEKTIVSSIAVALQFVLCGHVIWLAPHNAGPVPLIIIVLVVCLIFTCLSLITSTSLLAFTWRRGFSPSRPFTVPVPRWLMLFLCLPKPRGKDVPVNVRYVAGEASVSMETLTREESRLPQIPSWMLWCFLLDRLFFSLFLIFYSTLFVLLFK